MGVMTLPALNPTDKKTEYLAFVMPMMMALKLRLDAAISDTSQSQVIREALAVRFETLDARLEELNHIAAEAEKLKGHK